jgi:hypothetical protein
MQMRSCTPSACVAPDPGGGRLDTIQRHAFLLPKFRTFAAFAEGKAHHCNCVAELRMQRDRAAAAPDEISRVGADHQGGFARHVFLGHRRASLILGHLGMLPAGRQIKSKG